MCSAYKADHLDYTSLQLQPVMMNVCCQYHTSGEKTPDP